VVFAPAADGAFGARPVATLAPVGTILTNVRTAVADVNGDGIPDTALVTGPGTPIRVAVVSGADNSTQFVAPFDPFGGDFTGGGFVAARDLDGDGRAEFVVSPDQGGGPRVTVFSLPAGGLTRRANFFGIDDASFRGGARVALGDVNGNGTADVAVAAGFLGGRGSRCSTGRRSPAPRPVSSGTSSASPARTWPPFGTGRSWRWATWTGTGRPT
jgi:hypothetical protein